jgi:HD-GYP domain-containing protein (c-di-GMP phosphodiesterase class II)
MKKHVTYTKEILSGNMDYDIVEIAYRHHERLDGSGYPNKVKGENMTLDQKVLQVSDVISALVAKRSYKEAWDINVVNTILDQNVNDNKLDKSVVEMFKKHQDKVLTDANEVIEAANKKYDIIEKERYQLFRGIE